MSQPVDSSLVHKKAPEQVMLTSSVRTPDGSWTFEGVLPSSGPVAFASGDFSATLLGVELIRQAGIAYVHLAWDVPDDWAFMINELTFTWRQDPGTIRQLHTDPIQVRVHLSDARTHNGKIRDLQLTGDVLVAGQLIGTGRGDLTCLPRRAYQAIRRNAPPDPGHSTGPEGVVLSHVAGGTETLTAELTWNRNDRFIFDHFSDHIPGILIARASLHAHRLLTGSEAGHISLSCHTFAEYNAPVTVAASRSGSDNTRISITQADSDVATGDGGPIHPLGPDDDGGAGAFHRRLAPSRGMPTRPR